MEADVRTGQDTCGQMSAFVCSGIGADCGLDRTSPFKGVSAVRIRKCPGPVRKVEV